MLLEFLIAVLIIEVTPEPNLGYLAALSATRGRGAGLAATAGVALGLSTHAIAAAFGVGALIASHAWAYELLRWGGVAFFVWLAYEGWAGGKGELAGRCLAPGRPSRRPVLAGLLEQRP